MRYYAPWMCRFVSVDPLADKYPMLTPYNYASNSPVGELDVDGMQNPQQDTKPNDTGAANHATGDYKSAEGTYTVAEGDYLSSIAQRLGSSVSGIAVESKISDPDVISPGQVLKIPQGVKPVEFPLQIAHVGGAMRPGEEDSQHGVNAVPQNPDSFSGEVNWTDERLREEMLDALEDGTFGAMDDEAGRIAEHFFNRSGDDFHSEVIANEMQDEQEHRVLTDAIRDQFRQQMSANGGDISQLNLTQLPLPNYGRQDPSLLTLVGGTQEVNVFLNSIEFGDTTYDAAIRFDLIDTFGVHEGDLAGDIAAFFGGEGLRSFWILQHQRNYPPFRTIMTFTMNVRGSY